MTDITNIKTVWGSSVFKNVKGSWDQNLRTAAQGIEFAGHRVYVSSFFFYIIFGGLLTWLHCFIISKAICERSCYSVFLQNPWNCHNLNFCHSDGYFLASCYVYSCISLISENEAIYLVFLMYKIPVLFFYFSVPQFPLLVCTYSLQIMI